MKVGSIVSLSFVGILTLQTIHLCRCKSGPVKTLNTLKSLEGYSRDSYDILRLSRSRVRRDAAGDETLELHLRSDRHKIALSLTRNNDIIAKNFKYVVRDKDRNVLYDNADKAESCLYVGTAQGDLEGMVSLSRCHKTISFGLIFDENKAYVLEPLPVTGQASDKRNRQNDNKYVLLKVPEEPDLPHNGRKKRRAWASSDRNRGGIRSWMLGGFGSALMSEEGHLTNQTVEVALFEDYPMYEYVASRYPDSIHEKLKDIPLTLMSAVQLLYKHPSLGVNISFAVVRVEVVRDKYSALISNGDSEPYLEQFCEWQNNLKTLKKDNDPNNWDFAIMLSGLDLYEGEFSNGGNGSVGLAYVFGMCSESISCALVEGTRLSAAFVMAHEIGHSFGLNHDGEAGNSCESGKYLMSSKLSPGAVTWSACSQAEMKRFLKSKYAKCLSDPAGNAIPLDNMLPGEKYNSDEQCFYLYGKGWITYRDDKDENSFDICRELWCRATETLPDGRFYIMSGRIPALPGTPCGNNKICFASECVSKNHGGVGKDNHSLELEKNESDQDNNKDDKDEDCQEMISMIQRYRDRSLPTLLFALAYWSEKSYADTVTTFQECRTKFALGMVIRDSKRKLQKYSNPLFKHSMMKIK